LEAAHDEVTLEDLWKGTKTVLLEVARETIGSAKSQKKKKWISDDTYAVIREKREAKGKDKNQYQELKTVQKKLRVDKQQHLKLHKSQTGGKVIVKTCTTMRKGMELNKNIGNKSLHHFVQRLLERTARQLVAKPQVLMTPQQNCSKQDKRQHWTECTEYVWRSGKLLSGHRNGRSPHSSQFPRKAILNSVKTTEQLLWFPMQARYFFGSYWKGSE